eukprot:4480870-Alexandrium_andersonii.AAC.1
MRANSYQSDCAQQVPSTMPTDGHVAEHKTSPTAFQDTLQGHACVPPYTQTAGTPTVTMAGSVTFGKSHAAISNGLT